MTAQQHTRPDNPGQETVSVSVDRIFKQTPREKTSLMTGSSQETTTFTSDYD